MTLLGRVAELAACQQALSAGREGAAAAVITGAPGIGKTTVWRAAADAQPAGTVLRTTGLQGGQAGLANLADLLNPVADAVPRLPPPQAGALRAALGLAAADAPVTATLLELATTGLLRELAPAGVVVAVDDEQWVDQDSLRLLGSAVVRLKDVPVRWLVAVRSGHTGRGLAQILDHELGNAMTRLDLAGLDDAALLQLVMDRFPGRWSPGVLRRVVALSAGSPYAALELARETAAQGGRDGTAVHLPATLADSLRSRLDRLSPEVLAVVQAAAVAEAPTRALLRAVNGGAADGRVDEALEAGVLDADPPDPVLRFSHPLLREAAEAMLTGPGRRRLHRAIGAALTDPDQAAWHLARGADEPDETLAERAEQAARHASARGAPARAAALAQVGGRTHPRPRQPARLAAPYFLAGVAGGGGRIRAGAAVWARSGRRMSPPRCAGGSPLYARMWRRQTSRRLPGSTPKRLPTWPGGTPPGPRRPVPDGASTSESSWGGWTRLAPA